MTNMMVNPVKIPCYELMRFPGNEVAWERWKIRYDELMLERAKQANNGRRDNG